MKTFEEIFKAYSGDYQTTMARFMNNKTMYLRFFGMFFDDDNIVKLKTALEEQNIKAAFEAAHTLKGVSANMGLTPLCDAVCAIVEPLRCEKAEEDYMALYQKVQAEYKRVEELYESLKGGE